MLEFCNLSAMNYKFKSVTKKVKKYLKLKVLYPQNKAKDTDVTYNIMHFLLQLYCCFLKIYNFFYITGQINSH